MNQLGVSLNFNALFSYITTIVLEKGNFDIQTSLQSVGFRQVILFEMYALLLRLHYT